MTDDDSGSSRAPGLAAVALFGVLAAVVLSSAGGLADPAGYPAGESIVHNIGYALFDIDLGGISSEGFLAAFLIIALALDVALDSAVYLAKQEDQGSIISALTDGGQDIVESDISTNIDGEVAETDGGQSDVSGNIDTDQGGDA